VVDGQVDFGFLRKNLVIVNVSDVKNSIPYATWAGISDRGTFRGKLKSGGTETATKGISNSRLDLFAWNIRFASLVLAMINMEDRKRIHSKMIIVTALVANP